MRAHEFMRGFPRAKPVEDRDDLFEMANLEPSQTGIQGTIYISTQESSHAPRVKYFEGRPGNGKPRMSITISPNPKQVANSLPPHVAAQMEPIVKEWIQLNYPKLRSFWFDGNTWFKSEVDAFIAGLTKWQPPTSPPALQKKR